MEEYYPWRCELEIFSSHGDTIVNKHLSPDGVPLSIIELGAGDGAKTGKLLDSLQRSNLIFEYVPIDISAGAMDSLFGRLSQTHPGLDAHGIVANYMDGLENALKRHPKRRAVVLFLGSTIGNFTPTEVHDFTQSIHSRLRVGDIFMCGWDLKKNPSMLHTAYNDNTGVTGLFYRNVLVRANRELNTDFCVSNFLYHGAYDPVEGCLQLYLLPDRPCTIHMVHNGEKIAIDLKRYEPIFVNRSSKYNVDEVHKILMDAGFDSIIEFSDSENRFIDTIARK